MKKNTHWYTDGIIDRQFCDDDLIPEQFHRGRTNSGKGTKGYIGITNGTIETYVKPNEPIPEGFWVGWLNQSDEHKKHISEKLKNYVKTPEHCSNLSKSHKTIEYQEKIKQSCIDKYGVDNVFKSEEIKEKIKNVCLEKYGVEYITQNKEILRRARRKYKYNNEMFDSTWELALWIYAKDHNELIEREPCCFEYSFEGKKHIYFPDFKYKGNLVELKGDQFFKSDGRMQNPYNHLLDDFLEAKHQCGLSNGVLFWRKTDIQFAVDYVVNKYGRTYLQSFKMST